MTGQTDLMDSRSTVLQLVEQSQRRAPGQLAAIDERGRQLTYGDLRLRSNRLAHGLAGLGCKPTDRVAFVGNNSIEYVEIDLALVKANLVKVPLYFRLSAAELALAMERAEVTCVIADEASAAALDALDQPAAPVRIVIGSRLGWHSYEEVLAAGSDAAPTVPVRPDDTYHIRFTSGSSGPPKGIAISHQGARSAMLGNLWILSTQGWTETPRTLQQAPLVFAGGWTVLPTLLLGGCNVISPGFEPDRLVELIVDQGITWMFAVPTMLRRLAEVGRLDRLKTSSLNCLLYAGEPAPLDCLGTLTEATTALVQAFGQTEAPASTTCLSRAEHANPELWPSVGRAIPGVDFSVVIDDEVAEVPPAGVVGELVIRNVALTTGIIGAPEEYERRRMPNGWWRTGDLGCLDAESRIFIVGRLNDVIISGGSNIHPVEIEVALAKHSGVVEAIVAGVPDPVWGETPAALLYAPTLSADDVPAIRSWLSSELSRYKHPGHIVITDRPLPRIGTEAKASRGAARTVLMQTLGLDKAERGRTDGPHE